MRTDLPLSDEAVIAKSQEGELDKVEAASILLSRYVGGLLHVAKKRGLSAEDAEDLVQETLITALTRIVDFRTEDAPRAFRLWLYQIFKFKFFEYARRADRKAVEASTSDIADIPDTGSRDPLTLAAEDETTSIISAAIAELPPNESRILFLSYIEEMDDRHIAEELNITPSTVRVRRMRATAKLRDRLKQRNLTPRHLG